MMSPTHIGVGFLIAAPMLRLAPEFAVAAALGALVGGIVPDIDLFVGRHRKTLHYPVAFWLGALPLSLLAFLSPTAWTVGAAAALVSMAVHSGMDWFGAGDEPKPWKRTSREAVYLHLHRRWLEPKYWIRYDGAPEDVAVAVGGSLVGLLFPSPIAELAVANAAAAVVYALVRKQIPVYFDENL